MASGASVVAMTMLACGGGAGGPSVTPNGGGAAAGGDKPASSRPSDDEITKAYQKCKGEEESDEAKTPRCYQAWLDEYGQWGSDGQVKHAQRMANQSVAAPSPGNAPPADPHDEAPKPIVIDETHPPATKSSDANAPSPFPPQRVGYGECWRGMELTSNAVDDFNTLIDRCGRPTGMLPFSRVMQGQFDDKNKGDVYTVKLLAGGCYRFFAVAGGSIKDIDLAVASMEDKIISADKYTQPIAVVDWKDAVCVDQDVQFKLVIARDGGGAGDYATSIWFKPKGT